MVKTLIKSVRDAKIYAILTPIFMLGEAFTEVMLPSIMQNLIDEGINKGDMQSVVKYGAILLISTLVAMFFGITAGVTASRASSRFAKNLRTDMYSNIQNFTFSSIDRFSPASLVTRLTTDVTRNACFRVYILVQNKP